MSKTYDVVATIADSTPYETNIRTRQHQIISDEPEENGGQAKGPSPTEYILSGLGSCIVITLRMYADRKEWPLKKATVSLHADRERGENGFRTTIYKKLKVEGDLDEKQRNRLAQIADKCPVSKMLAGDITHETEIVE
mgnify:CR=1 FL=1